MAKRISAARGLDGRVRHESGPVGSTPVPAASVGDKLIAIASEGDSSDLEFTVAKVEFRAAAPGRRAYVFYSPLPGSERILSGGLTPDSSEEQLAKHEAQQHGLS